MYELLLELRERLEQIGIVGLKSVSEDFRLKKLQEKLKVLSSKAPVLAKLYELITKLIEEEEKVSYFTELNNLVNAILCTQGSSKAEGVETEVEIFEHQAIKPLTYRQLQEVRNILSGGTNAKWANLKKAYDQGALIDYRLLEDFLDNIGDTYEYVDYDYTIPYSQREVFSMQTILAQYGKDIVPLLLKRFESSKPTEKANIVKLMYRIGREEYNDYYRKWIEDEEADAVIINAMRALGDEPENEAFLLAYKTRKKKVQEARILSLAQIGSQEAIKEVKKYCFKDSDLFTTVFSKFSFLDEEEFLNLILDSAKKLNEDKKIDKLRLYANKDYTFLRHLMTYLNRYSPAKVIETLKQIMALQNEEGEYFEVRIGCHLISDMIYGADQPELLAYLASIKEQYEGYYIADSFVAALKCYESEKVYDEFASLITKKYPKGKTTIKQVLDQINFTTADVEYDDECATCEERDTCDSSTFRKEPVIRQEIILQEIILDGDRRILLKTNQIKWDSRWIETAKTLGMRELSAYFGLKCMDETTKPALREEYIKMLNEFKEEVGKTDTYPNLDGQKRKLAENEIKNILSGLMLTGAVEEVVNHTGYFIFYLATFEQVIFKYLKMDEIGLLDHIEVKGLSTYKKKKITDFIERAKKIVYAINGKMYGQAHSCN